MDKIRAIISDASVLIDLIKADKEVLEIAAGCFDLHISYLVLDEINQLDESKAKALGLKIYEESPEMLEHAFGQESSLSPADWACLAIAKKEGYHCLTNDQNLYNRCGVEGVNAIRGLRLLLVLVEKEKITKSRARTTAETIRKQNVLIKARVFEDFFQKLADI
ncbi:MAG TPA: hypothetical protein P5511_00800 [Candidatus Goldiibacteriota bacterium]|nr:hypothetical protein [Candidatus Goldiibacteriota bacterium]